jgi:hypothetical protein
MAERAGFEPAVPCGTPDFESGTFDHSATSPSISFLILILANIGKIKYDLKTGLLRFLNPSFKFTNLPEAQF